MICKKCNSEYPDEEYCQNPTCLIYTIQKIVYPSSGGTFTYLVGMKYPYEGYSDYIVVGQNATVKRAVISTFRLFYGIWLHPINTSINWLAEIYEAEYEKYQIEETRLSKSSREILRVLKSFAKNERHIKAVWCIVMFWELDFAYRYRGQDILSELNKDNLSNVKKEIERLFKIGMDREVKGLEVKWKIFRKALSIALLFPKVKKAARKFLFEINLEEIKPSINDLYYMSRYTDYNFAGLPYKIRKEWKKQEDEDYVPPIINPIEYANVDVRPNKFFFSLKENEMETLLENVKGRLREEYKKNEQRRMDDTTDKNNLGSNSPIITI